MSELPTRNNISELKSISIKGKHDIYGDCLFKATQKEPEKWDVHAVCRPDIFDYRHGQSSAKTYDFLAEFLKFARKKDELIITTRRGTVEKKIKTRLLASSASEAGLQKLVTNHYGNVNMYNLKHTRVVHKNGRWRLEEIFED